MVHAAWKALLRQASSRHQHSERATERAREINEAFAVLGKPDSRADYDRSRGRRRLSRRIASHRQPRSSAPAPARRRRIRGPAISLALLPLVALPTATRRSSP